MHGVETVNSSPAGHSAIHRIAAMVYDGLGMVADEENASYNWEEATMYVTLVSLIIQAALAMTRAQGAVTSVPLDRMAHALASAHSYRVVFTNAQEMNHVTNTTTFTVVRRGSVAQTYTVLTSALPGQKPLLLAEQIDTGIQGCVRPTHAAPWRCTPLPRAARTGPGFLDVNAMLRTLHWTRLANAVVQGRRCQGYRTTWQAGPSINTQATLWIALDSSRPVEVTATTSSAATVAGQSKTQNRSVETAIWSAWNSPSLQVPHV